MTLVSLIDILPHAIFQLRYTTPHNITGKVLATEQSVARLDMAAATRLSQAAAKFKEQGRRIVVWDAYRSADTQKELLASDPDKKYVLELSQHSLGLAVDITLATEDGMLLDMGTDHDEFSERAHPNTTKITDLQRANRLILINTMSQYGFTVWPYEWWHFDFAAPKAK